MSTSSLPRKQYWFQRKGDIKMIWLLLTLRVMVSEGQLTITNKDCPADLGQNMRELRDDYLTTSREHQRVVKENEEIKNKYEKEIQEIQDELNSVVEELNRENSLLSSMNITYAMDCKWYHERDPTLKSGVYELLVDGLDFPAYCEMEIEGGGWTVIFSRNITIPYDGNRTWQEYRDGFGNVKGNHWLGNEKMHRLTKRRPSDVLTYLVGGEPCKTKCRYNLERYSKLTISSETNKYRVIYSNHSSLINENLMKEVLEKSKMANNTEFSTYDNDNDRDRSGSCAAKTGNGWWYGGMECFANPLAKNQVSKGNIRGVIMIRFL